MAKTIDGAIGYVGTEVSNYIKQINDGTTTHDIAVQNGIKFFNGGTEIAWDGKQAVEVVIPTLADIVSSPVVLKGIINKADDIPANPQDGYLVYIGTTGSYFTPAVACEAGDMAVYYDKKWNVISGENQISLAGGTVDASGHHVVLTDSATKVIDVEGLGLTLAVDYSGILGKISAESDAAVSVPLADGKTTISNKYISLNQADSASETIGVSTSFNLPYALASDAVTIADKVLVADNFKWDAGTLPSITKNSSKISIEASHNMSIVASGDGAFVTDITAIKGVSLSNADALTQGAFGYVSGLSVSEGKTFMSGIHAHAAGDGDKPADFTVPGYVVVDASANTFATGFGEASTTKGDVISAITVGKVEGTFVSGLTGGSNVVVKDVTFGSIEKNAEQWFVTGLEDSAAAVTAVSFGEVVVTPEKSDAVVSASVSNHILSFNTGKFVTSATASLSGTGVTTKAFTKGGVALTGFSFVTDTLATGSVSQAETSISYRSLNKAAVSIAQDPLGYHYDTAKADAYTALMGYKTLVCTAADVTKNGASLANTAITANIPAEAVVVGFNAGTLPSFSVEAASGVISGKVANKALASNEFSFYAVDSTKATISLPGAYTLVEVSAAGDGVVDVAKAGTYDVSGHIVNTEGAFVTDIKVDGSSIA